MANAYLGHLPRHDRLYSYLEEEIFPRIGGGTGDDEEDGAVPQDGDKVHGRAFYACARRRYRYDFIQVRAGQNHQRGHNFRG